MCGYTEFDNVVAYLKSRTDLLARINAIEGLIDDTILLLASNVGGQGGNIAFYELDDGQVRIKTGYRSIQDISEAVTALQKMKNIYENQFYGRKITLRDRNTLNCRRGHINWNISNQ